MTCLINLLLYSIQYYGIFYGFTFAYVDIKRNIIKLPKFLKYYKNCVNLIYAAISIYFVIRRTNFTLYRSKDVLSYFFAIVYYIQIFILLRLILLHLREEKAIKKWFKTFTKLLIISQFNKITLLSMNKTIKYVQILSIILIFILSFYSVYMLIMTLIYEKLYKLLDACIIDYLIIMEYYILLKHSFILSYIGNCFSSLNNKMRNGQLRESFGKIYFQLSLILQEVNILNGTFILCVLVSQILQISLNVINMFETMLYMHSLNETFNVFSIIPCIIVIQSTNIFLYFKICDHVCRTTRKTGRIMIEYYLDKENSEVCTYFNDQFLIF